MNSKENPIIKIGDKEYELVFTLKAAREIIERFDGLENIAEALYNQEDWNKLMDDIIWLIMILANQGIIRYNFYHKEDPRALLTQEEIEALFAAANAGASIGQKSLS